MIHSHHPSGIHIRHFGQVGLDPAEEHAGGVAVEAEGDDVLVTTAQVGSEAAAGAGAVQSAVRRRRVAPGAAAAGKLVHGRISGGISDGISDRSRGESSDRVGLEVRCGRSLIKRRPEAACFLRLDPALRAAPELRDNSCPDAAPAMSVEYKLGIRPAICSVV